MARKTGKPKKLEQDDELPKDGIHGDGSLEQFVQNMHSETGPSQKIDGMPSIEWLKSQFKTKSAVIRYLVSEQCMRDHKRTEPFPIKDIAKHLGVRYQHVRNVATSPLKRGPNEDWRPKQKPEPQ